jgi:hypothetical protein
MFKNLGTRGGSASLEAIDETDCGFLG